jgi:hypothetical protein
MVIFGDKTQMKKAIEDAVKELAEKASADKVLAHEAMQWTQAVLNLTHALQGLDCRKR